MHIEVNDISDNQVVRMDDHFFAKSMSDITMSPISLTSCMYRERLMFTVAYNEKWIVRSFATNFIDTFLTVLHEVVCFADSRFHKNFFELIYFLKNILMIFNQILNACP